MIWDEGIQTRISIAPVTFDVTATRLRVQPAVFACAGLIYSETSTVISAPGCCHTD
jgi:hypothetical protein